MYLDLLACQVRVTVSDSGLCRCVCVCPFILPLKKEEKTECLYRINQQGVN